MIGDNIKRLMKANGYKQKELAIRSGCTESAISKYANNEREPSIKALKNLAIALGVTVDELLGNATLDVVPREEVERIKREIFEEIESIISPMLGLEDDKEYVAILTTTFAELKKKYTEDGK